MARRGSSSPSPLVLDSGAVIALSRADDRARAFLARARELGSEVLVPVCVVAETIRGGAPDASVNRVLSAVGSVPSTTEATGRVAGNALGRARSSATIDALVLAEAVSRGRARILTGDVHDLRRLATPFPDVVVDRV